ncbi:YqeG family HAD IIIA-type phosphatase [Candidatus Acetothermia bacterium]|nr:MAG: YqeG family HAD IIIA-type phosphatase [Candidatus Acetothermia bacterium]
MRPLRPKSEAPSVHAVDYRALWERGLRALIFDLDNTLARWRAGPPADEVLTLLGKLKEQGFKVAVLSNGRLSKRPEVLRSFSELGIPVIWPARKPLPAGFKQALRELAARPGETVMIGDQLFTDVLGGNLVGLYTVLVRPLDPGRESRFTKLNRWLERLSHRRRPVPGR